MNDSSSCRLVCLHSKPCHPRTVNVAANGRSIILIVILLILDITTSAAQFQNFVTARGDKLMDGNKELRFISFNLPNLHYIEDNFEFTNPNPWRIPDEFEIRDALTAIQQAGGTVTRIYVPSVRKQIDDPHIIRHVNGPGEFDEEAFRAYDKVLQIANEKGIRIIIPLVDNWWWWGGPKEYAAFRGKTRDEFWTDSLLISDFEKTIAHLINRVNTYTGVQFKDDKAILGWETGNELEPTTYQWTRTIAAYIKSLDKNHLVIEGTHSSTISDSAVDDPNIDVLSTHYYLPAYKMIPLMLAARAKAKGRKPYFVGEFGFMPTDSIRCVLDSVIANGISGIMIWSMRGHNRDGGFYYHGFSYRWPGFPSGAFYDEINVEKLFRQKAYEINGEDPPPLPIPEAPTPLPVETPYKISWEGSTGATSYIIERKPKWRLFWWNWDVVDSNASDAIRGYRPLYSDTSVELGTTYEYRFIAKNSSGSSEAFDASNYVVAYDRMLIDEFSDSSHFFAKSVGVKFIRGGRADRTKDDFDRVEGNAGDYIMYRLPAGIDSVSLDAYFTTSRHDSSVSFFSGPSSENLSSIPSRQYIYEPYKNEYGFYTAVRYIVRHFQAEDAFLKIMLTPDIQLGRIEISYGSITDQ
jgi:mannan endo-1,4-beta-mannosidase